MIQDFLNLIYGETTKAGWGRYSLESIFSKLLGN